MMINRAISEATAASNSRVEISPGYVNIFRVDFFISRLPLRLFRSERWFPLGTCSMCWNLEAICSFIARSFSSPARHTPSARGKANVILQSGGSRRTVTFDWSGSDERTEPSKPGKRNCVKFKMTNERE